MAMPGASNALASDLIARIKDTTGLTQAELARRSGIQPSVLSAYERGQRQPSVAALGRIASAAGLELQVTPLTDSDALERAGAILVQVLDLADRMPSKPRGELRYPPLVQLAA